MGVREAAVEKYLHDQVTKRGGMTWKFTSPSRVGVPDRIIRLPQWPVGMVWFAEVKTEDGKLSSVQEREIERMRSLGMCVVVLYGKAEVDMFLEE